MQRQETGRYETTMVDGNQARAFVPAPLPPHPPLQLDGVLPQQLSAAMLALGRLDSITELLPNAAVLRYSYIRKEAVLSSQIEGAQPSLSDLLLSEATGAPGVPHGDVAEVSSYVAALEHGLERLKNGFPLSGRLIREVHEILMSAGRGARRQMPGEFRRLQNWVGGASPGTAGFVPPPHTAVPDCMYELERFLHLDDGMPALLRAALAYMQFETIHPFLDGNGRVGRLLITLLLCRDKVLHEPLLYLSLHFKRNRRQHYESLNDVRRTGDWEAWLNFFLAGVRTTAESAFATARRLLRLFDRDSRSIGQISGRRTGSVGQVHAVLTAYLYLSLPKVCRATKLSYRTASKAMEVLTELGIVEEVTGKSRNRVFVYKEYLEVLNEQMEE